MDIDKLITVLLNMRDKYGNMTCVVETEDLFGKKIDSTVESMHVVDFLDRKALRLDWRM